MLEIKLPRLTIHPIFKNCYADIKCAPSDLEQTGTVILDITEPILLTITGEYEQDPSNFQSDIHSVNILFNTLLKSTHAISEYLIKNPNLSNNPPDLQHEPLLQFLTKTLANYNLYFYIIHKSNIDKLFPNTFEFAWVDTMSNQSHIQHSWAFEKANLLFNMAQLHYLIASLKSQQGTPSASSDFLAGLSPAIHFQHSAILFQFIKINFLHAPTDDMQAFSLDSCSNFQLANAQYQMLISCKSNKLKVKLCTGICDLLKSSSNTTDLSLLQGYSHIFKSLQEDELKHQGERIARLQLALVFFKTDKEMLQLLKLELATAIKENDLVYHELIPKKDELLALESLIAVTIPPAITIDHIYASGGGPSVLEPNYLKFVKTYNDGKPLFNTLVPMHIIENASVYSDKVGKMIRDLEQKSVETDAPFETWLANEHVVLRLNKWKRKNTGMDDNAAKVSDSDAKELQNGLSLIKQLEQQEALSALIHKLSQTKQQTINIVNSHGIASIQQAIQQASRNDDQLQAQIGELQSNSLYHAVLVKMDINQYISKYGGTSTTTATNLITVDNVGPKMTQMVEILETWYSTKKQREMVVQEIKDMAQNDVINNDLLAYKGDLEILFKHKMEKYDGLKQRLAEFDVKSVKLTSKVQGTWDELVNTTTFKKEEIALKGREQGLNGFIKTLQQSKETYEEIRENLMDGIQFYSELQAQANKIGNSQKGGQQVFQQQQPLQQQFNQMNIRASTPQHTQPNEQELLMQYMQQYPQYSNSPQQPQQPMQYSTQQQYQPQQYQQQYQQQQSQFIPQQQKPLPSVPNPYGQPHSPNGPPLPPK